MIKHKVQNEDAVTYVKMNAFGWTQRQQTAKLSNHTGVSSSPRTFLISNMCLKLENSYKIIQ